MTPVLVPQSGKTEPRGATLVEGGVNFAVYSETASVIFVCLYDGADNEIARIELDGHTDNVHCGLIGGIAAGARYGLRADGPYKPEQALHFDPQKLLIDPYARQIDRPLQLVPELSLPRDKAVDTAPFVPKAIVMSSDDALPVYQSGPGLVYELNVRGYTKQHPHIDEAIRGTIAALTNPEIITHLLNIGVTSVELMPVAAWMDDPHLPKLGLTNAWGYNPIAYFVPDPRLMPNGLSDLRQLTETYRRHNISVILDVVYNHTGESDGSGPVISMQGLDAATYYRHVKVDGVLEMVNDAGTGNTLRCDHPEVQRLTIDSLKYWVEAGGVSGFRFDLAPILGRTGKGFDAKTQLLNKIKSDPVLSQCQLYAEPWDPGPGGYQLGAFGKGFSEWNDRYRDDIRSFWRGDNGEIGALAERLAGSSKIFNHEGRLPSAGVNFLAVHDGFTLRDLVSYVDRHNEANGEHNRDGHSYNGSWNCGVEGATDDAEINAHRQRDVRALLATLFVSRGTLLIQQGDEFGRTQRGNNNAYAQDNDITWLDWENADRDLSDYVALLNRFRQAHPALNADRFLTGKPLDGARDVIWWHPDGHEMSDRDWHDDTACVLGMQLHMGEDEVLVWINRWRQPVRTSLPPSHAGRVWCLGLSSVDELVDLSAPDREIDLPARSVIILCPAV